MDINFIFSLNQHFNQLSFMKKVYLIIVVMFTILTIPSFAQVNIGGQPYSYTAKGISLNVPAEMMPQVDVATLLAEDKASDGFKDRPWRFGENIEVNFNPKNSGILETLANGATLWRLTIETHAALSVNLLFDEYHLPEGATLHIYSTDQKNLIGGFTSANNQKDKQFATTLVRGSQVTVEYYEPASVDFSGSLNISRVTHGYRSVENYSRSLGSSGNCNMNVACPDAAPWSDEIRSAAMMVTGGSGFCSGAMINNTNEDGTPYFLTADHCYSDPGGWVFWFNWQSEDCDNPSSSPSHDDVSGATLRARNADSDFCLVELNSAPPASYEVFYAGWNRADVAATTQVGIHHPSGDIKKISFNDDQANSTDYMPNAYLADSHWEIPVWDRNTTTEGGSSGSPLFDENHRIVGQLHGGWASCTSATADYYGKLSMSWDRGGSSSNQLKDWLDPTDSGVEVIDGYDENASTYALDAQVLSMAGFDAEYCEIVNTTPEVNIKNRGTDDLVSLEISYQIDSETPIVENWTGTLATGETATVTFPEITLTMGNHTLTTTISNANATDDENSANDVNVINYMVVDGQATLPVSEGFENSALPVCWNYEGGNWSFTNGGNNGNPSSAHTGSVNALFFNGTYDEVVSKIVSSKIDLSGVSSASLSFWHAQKSWSGDQDELRIYYKNSAQGEWVMLAEYTEDVSAWKDRALDLPELSDDYYVAFEGTTYWGRGVAIDDILIDVVTGNEHEIKTNKLSVYPNPSEGIFTIDISLDYKLSVTNISGKQILNSSSDEGKTIDLTSFGAGVYFLQVTTEESVYTQKVVIK